MFNAFMITLREGIEAFLIVAITLAYLRKTGREALGRAVYLGIGVAVVASYLASLLFARANNQALWEGVLALVTAVGCARAGGGGAGSGAAFSGAAVRGGMDPVDLMDSMDAGWRPSRPWGPRSIGCAA